MDQAEFPASTHGLVALRELRLEDIPRWHNYLMQPVVYEPTSWDTRDPGRLFEQLRAMCGASQTGPANSSLRFAIVHSAANELVGTAGFHSICPEERSAEIAFDLAPDYWDKGIATCVCSDLVAWAFERFNWIRIQATVLPSNRRSIKVLENNGFRCAGLLRSHRLVRGTPTDFLSYAMRPSLAVGR